MYVKNFFSVTFTWTLFAAAQIFIFASAT